MEKRYTYYVATFNVWTLVEADNAKEAIALGEQAEILKGHGDILTARIATKDEKEQHEWHQKKLAEEASRTLPPQVIQMKGNMTNDGPGFEPKELAPGLVFLPSQPDDDAYSSLMGKAYDGNGIRLETLIHDDDYDPTDPDDIGPGLWLQAVEFDGYDAKFYTPEQAELLAVSIESNMFWISDFPRTYRMTAEEAKRVADMLRKGVAQAKTATAITPEQTATD